MDELHQKMQSIADTVRERGYCVLHKIEWEFGVSRATVFRFAEEFGLVIKKQFREKSPSQFRYIITIGGDDIGNTDFQEKEEREEAQETSQAKEEEEGV
ncbi:MAG: hypothetical protein AM325_015780 [Candidatus Thorarchaeota archaeon SMTZ1-45]